MNRTVRSCALVITLFALALVPRSARAAWSHDPAVNNPVMTLPLTQYFEQTIPDGAGGAFVLWQDLRTSPASQIVQHVTASGSLAPGWLISGAPVATPVGFQYEGRMLADGAGGVYVAWSETRATVSKIFLQRLTSAGLVAPGWPASGLQVSNDSKDEVTPRICSDNAGGVWVAWTRRWTGSDYDPGAAHVLANGSIAAGPFFVDANGGFQTNPAIAADALGNLIVAYEDNLSGDYDIHLKKFSAAGAELANAVYGPYGGDQREPLILPDGFNGALVSFTEAAVVPSSVAMFHVGAGLGVIWNAHPLQATFDIRTGDMVTDGANGAYLLGKSIGFFSNVWSVTHVTAIGSTPTGWPANTGLAAVFGLGTEARIGSDQKGGALLLGWSQYTPMHTLRLNANGAFASIWPGDLSGVVTSINAGVFDGGVVPDGAGGGIAVWGDFRNSSDYSIYAQRIDRFGKLGSAEPAIASVKDVALDQGGRLRVSWTPSYLDADPTYGVFEYRIWRQLPVYAAQQAIAQGAVSVARGEAVAASGKRVVTTRPNGAEVTYWELAGTQVASALPGYSFIVNTAGDSTAEGFAHTVCMVEAVGNGGGFWDSAPDSGYSVDNLAPARPAPFTAAWGGATHLTWGPNKEADLAGYRLYRGATPGFVPDGSTFWAETPDTGLVAPAGNFYWKLVAFDAHGNVSPVATLSPPGSVGVGDALPTTLAFSLTSANPSRGAAVLRLALPRAARVRVAVYDAAGRLVRTLADGSRDAGEYALAWDGRDAAGREAGAGLYFARMSSDGQTRVVRMARL